MNKSVWKCINIIAISPTRGMEQAEIIDTFWTYQSSVVLLEPFKNKVSKPRRQGPGKRSLPGRPTQAPARGSCWEETRPRQEELAGKATQGIPRKLAATRPASRQGPVSDKLPNTTRRRPRQGACHGKPPLRARAPAHLLTCRSRTLPSTRGRRPRS